jgi:exodeoxyribonuclease VII, small subunit
MTSKKTTPPAQPVGFEAGLAELDDIVTRLESGELPLEDALALFERGSKVVRECRGRLEAAELRVRQLSAGGELSDFEDGPSPDAPEPANP